MKSIAIYSIARVGFKKIRAYMIFLSISSGVVVVSSRINLKSERPKLVLMSERIGVTEEIGNRIDVGTVKIIAVLASQLVGNINNRDTCGSLSESAAVETSGGKPDLRLLL